MSKWYVYTLSYPPQMEGGRVFYVGKGTGDRIDTHEYRAHARVYGLRPKAERLFKSYSARSRTIRAIEAAGYKVVKAKVFETDDEVAAYRKEFDLIREYGPDNLTNVPDGFHTLHGFTGKAVFTDEPQAATD